MAAGNDFDYLDEHLTPAYGGIEEAKAYRRAALADSYYSCDKCHVQGSTSQAYWKATIDDCGNRKQHDSKKMCNSCGHRNNLAANVCAGKCGKGLAPHRCGDCKYNQLLNFPCLSCGHVTVVETQGKGIGFTHQTPQSLDD